MDNDARKMLSEELNQKFLFWRNVNKKVDRVLLVILLVGIAVTGFALLDNLAFLDKGIQGVKYHDFDELLAINPDTVAWLTVDGTHIDHPVVQGKDNFEYLDKAFTGEFYAGGTLFLDCKNDKGFRDGYNIIHGHHMNRGAMFGDLEKFLETDFFEKNRTGKLLTPAYDYDLEIIAAGIFNAYDSEVYAVGDTQPIRAIQKKARQRRDFAKDGKPLLALSTCSGEMNDDRIVVFCRMINQTKHK